MRGRKKSFGIARYIPPNNILFQAFQKLLLVPLFTWTWRVDCLLLVTVSYMHHSCSVYPCYMCTSTASCAVQRAEFAKIKMQLLSSGSLEAGAGGATGVENKVWAPEPLTCLGPIQSSKRGPRNGFIGSCVWKYFAKVSQFVCNWLRTPNSDSLSMKLPFLLSVSVAVAVSWWAQGELSWEHS